MSEPSAGGRGLVLVQATREAGLGTRAEGRPTCTQPIRSALGRIPLPDPGFCAPTVLNNVRETDGQTDE